MTLRGSLNILHNAIHNIYYKTIIIQNSDICMSNQASRQELEATKIEHLSPPLPQILILFSLARCGSCGVGSTAHVIVGQQKIHNV